MKELIKKFTNNKECLSKIDKDEFYKKRCEDTIIRAANILYKEPLKQICIAFFKPLKNGIACFFRGIFFGVWLILKSPYDLIKPLYNIYKNLKMIFLFIKYKKELLR
ncbi:hypothetical protein [Campylobacter sp.]|uniref:hypothetical protein n=1 Tax=Campylobacter sp. TaxID=205 RepID=UPI0025BD40F0|nr:hypothetical protein [Campylobacter sp.]